MNRRALRTVLLLLLAAALAAFVWRSLQDTQAEQAAEAAPAPAPVVQLGPLDVLRVQTREIEVSLPISGTLRAVQTARVKARVPGELMDLQVREGDSVKAGQVIARVQPTEYNERLRQAQRQVDAARAQANIAQRQYDNNQALVEKGFISRTALDNSAADLEAARANVRAAQAAAAVARTAVDDTVLKAPIAGQIAARMAQPGERVSPEAPIVEIVDSSQLELETALSPGDSVAVRVGQTATLEIEGTSGPVPATVARINPSAQAGSRSVLAYLAIKPTPGLRQGLFAEGQLVTGRQQALAVPLASVRSDKPAPYVQLVVGEDETRQIAHRSVEPGTRIRLDGETWVTVSGLVDGELVLNSAAGALAEGTQVQLTQAIEP